MIKQIINFFLKFIKKPTISQDQIPTADLVGDQLITPDKPKMDIYPPIKTQEQTTEDLISGHTLCIPDSEAEVNWIKFKSTEEENK